MKLLAFRIQVAIVVLMSIGIGEASETEVRVYELKYRDGAETVRFLEPMLSPMGEITYYEPTHSVVINDIPSVHARIKTALSDFDRVRFRFVMDVYELPNRILARFSRNVKWASAGGGWGIGLFGEDEYAEEVRLKIVQWIDGAQKEGSRVARAVGFAGQSSDLWIGPVAAVHDARLRDYLRRSSPEKKMEILGGLETGYSWTVSEGEPPQVRLTPQILYQTADFRGVREIPGHEAHFSFPEGEWFVLSSGGKGGDVLVLLYGAGGGEEGFNLLVRIRRDG